ncbi:HTH-type transcriptional regulator MtrR [compost metagenome]|jgi:AcrR family transcriptional regulator|uniref:TetR/AcrR family transcriptional regulator n=3 Tax=Sphingobacterium TaxID=28453 RepID=A0ABX7CL28_SPHMU|nr:MULTISPECIES: TetR/AcrR family transcriptional regulator [Sphingobacterium]MCS4165609.1 AcrR family transcriptional regulator [Sphingobacterium sp. BIGb0116]QMV69080.1 TetR/AcrR family transcriptional regulator [Sphingobacterium paramultivorum]QQT31595.1 TetR/AcrR family transcriptional regulator [Sphingobacterium multivorum]QQT52464.1 TetR/AcrR family transcriptional regulator [Sphingobacterium multivorum]QRY57580.1 TetR/AcrR family transcriptional regulator [Sphingobacterium siyangense]
MNKKEQVKERIGQAAMECFERYGLEKTTLEDIAKTVGLNKTSLYYYYKNKEDIFIEVAIREGQSFIDTLQKSTLKKKGVENQISFYLESRLNYYTNVLNMNRVSVESLDKILPRFFELYDAMMVQEKAFLTKLLTQAIAHEKLDLTDPENIASVLINFANALKHSTEQQAILKRQVEIDYAQSLRDTKFLVSLIFRGLRI